MLTLCAVLNLSLTSPLQVSRPLEAFILRLQTSGPVPWGTEGAGRGWNTHFCCPLCVEDRDKAKTRVPLAAGCPDKVLRSCLH